MFLQICRPQAPDEVSAAEPRPPGTTPPTTDVALAALPTIAIPLAADFHVQNLTRRTPDCPV